MTQKVRLIAFDVAVVGREVDAHVDRVVQRERREYRQIVGGDIVAGAPPELGAVLVERGDYLGGTVTLALNRSENPNT